MIPVFKIDRIKKGLSNFERIRARALSRVLLQPRVSTSLRKKSEEDYFRIAVGDHIVFNDFRRGVGGFMEKDVSLYYILGIQEEDPPKVFSNKLYYVDLPLHINNAAREDSVYEKITFKDGLEIYREEEFTKGHRSHFYPWTSASEIRARRDRVYPSDKLRDKYLKLSPHQSISITALRVYE